eukprot:GGOE01036558.1.p2 GENE.GGOE01036558.1~~GGOE01036558.1.p2  ORF type:complete len:206 (-),score=64.71 GGOE01036558.1:179-796(-)
MPTPVLPGTPVGCKPGKKTFLISQGRRKFHMILTDGSEMVEEFDLGTDQLLVRKVRKASTLGREGPWTFEIGSDAKSPTLDANLLVPSATNPVVVALDTPAAFQWRIRNLPYPSPTYQLSIDTEAQIIVVRTTNKKYYTRLPIPTMSRACLALEADNLQWEHKNNTLVVEYQKPPELLQREAVERKERLSRKPEDQAAPSDCKTQ